MSTPKWNFPNNNYTFESGLDTSDMETFKKDPISSLAREICQNSIDAPSGSAPVRVEFSLFDVKREEVPGVEKLSEQIRECYDYKGDSEKEGKALQALHESIQSEVITCMRVSDFNTTGVTGVESSEKGTPFYNLTKGSGVSDKGVSSGGSKGIGKFASFVVSTTNTVFYSTRTNDGHEGYIGISKLRSTPIPGEDPELMTMGTGYFGLTERNHPIPAELKLDPSFSRQEHEYGTDIFLIGFNKSEQWTSEIIAKVLEGFMVAIVRGKLEVVVDDMSINSETVESIIYGPSFDSFAVNSIIKDIRAQYELLQGGEGVKSEQVFIDDEISVTVYMKEYSQNNASQATKRCIMVRYPYMKIKHITTGAYLPFSALCVIEENTLNDNLRRIENPQHTDWEIKRLDDFPQEKAVVWKGLKALQDNVRKFIIDSLRESSGESTDLIGAGEFLPAQDDFGESAGESTMSDKPRAAQITASKPRVPQSMKQGELGESFEFGEGAEDDEGDPGSMPGGPGSSNPNPYDDPEPDPDDDIGIGEGNQPVLRKFGLSGMRYRNIVRSATEGKYTCVFTSQYEEENCELAIRQRGESKDRYEVKILNASIQGNPCEIANGKIVNLSISKGEVYRIDYQVAKTELFASEVIVNAYR